MIIKTIDLTKTKLSMYPQIIDQCQEIINENLQSNGGTLKVSNIFERDYKWTNLIIAIYEDKVVGFALIRLGDSKHNLKNSNEYYYLSDVVVKRKYQTLGIGTALMSEVISCIKKMPLVASCLKENQASINLLSKFMTCYGFSDSGNYMRFVNNESYAKLYSGVTRDSSNPTESIVHNK